MGNQKKRQRTAAVVVRETADDVEARRWEKLAVFSHPYCRRSH